MDHYSAITPLYQELLMKLQTNPRPRLKLDAEILKEALQKVDQRALILLNYSHDLLPAYQEDLFQLLEIQTNPDILVSALTASHRHLLDDLKRKGDRIPVRYLLIIKRLLSMQDLTIREWSLVTIEMLGNQAFGLKEELKKLRPHRHLFSAQKKRINQLLFKLQKRWS